MCTGLQITCANRRNEPLQQGDIRLALNPAADVPSGEGYELRIAEGVVVVAPGVDGVLFGTRTLLQLLSQDLTLPGGVVRDWPAYPERGVMIDVGRKYFTLDWLRSHVKELSYLKLNYLHLHLTDNLGFRVESASHPEVVSTQHYTKHEITDLVDLARQHGVMVVPEFDMPGHLDQVLRAHPELRLIDVDGVAAPDKIDLTNEGSYELLADLLNELIPLFPAPYFHIGADEYLEREEYVRYPQLETHALQTYGANAVGKDVYLGFINWANQIVRSHGKTARAWTDGMYGGNAVAVDTNIVAEHWIDVGPSPEELIKSGHRVMNGNIERLYYTLGTKRAPDPRYLYETFEPSMFNGSHLPPEHPSHLGAKLHVWELLADDETEGDVALALHHSLRSFAQITWGTPGSRLVPTWEEFVSVIDGVSRAPGESITMPRSVAHRRPVAASSEHVGHPVALVVDGDPTTYWRSAPEGEQSVRIDLGSRMPIARVTAHWRGDHPGTYRLQISDDESRWRDITVVTRGGAFHVVDPIEYEGRFVRLLIPEPSNDVGHELYEIAVYAA